MTTRKTQEKLTHFKKEVLEKFAFLHDYGYELKDNEIGQDTTYLDYFAQIAFIKGSREIHLSYRTDIINGMMLAFPQIKKKPGVDDTISISIYDENALLIVSPFIAETHREIDPTDFEIHLSSITVAGDITRVVDNYIKFMIIHLKEVIEGKRMYNCYINKDYETVLEEVI